MSSEGVAAILAAAALPAAAPVGPVEQLGAEGVGEEGSPGENELARHFPQLPQLDSEYAEQQHTEDLEPIADAEDGSPGSADRQQSDALDGSWPSQSDRQPILELPDGLPGQSQVGPKYK